MSDMCDSSVGQYVYTILLCMCTVGCDREYAWEEEGEIERNEIKADVRGNRERAASDSSGGQDIGNGHICSGHGHISAGNNGGSCGSVWIS